MRKSAITRLPANFGYVRVSVREQNADRQLIALEPCDIPPANLFIDKKSGKDFNRPQYMKLLRSLRQGDTLYIKSIDRYDKQSFTYSN